MLDDLQNAGLATVELLHYLARHATGSRLLVLATVRAEEGDGVLTALAEVAGHVELGPLRRRRGHRARHRGRAG